MALYFFHLCNGVDTLLDEEGQELSDHNAVVVATLKEARAIISADSILGTIPLDHHLDVHDVHQKVIHRLDFADAVMIMRPVGG